MKIIFTLSDLLFQYTRVFCTFIAVLCGVDNISGDIRFHYGSRLKDKRDISRFHMFLPKEIYKTVSNLVARVFRVFGIVYWQNRCFKIRK